MLGFTTLREAEDFAAVAHGARRVSTSGGATVEAPAGGVLAARVVASDEKTRFAVAVSFIEGSTPVSESAADWLKGPRVDPSRVIAPAATLEAIGTLYRAGAFGPPRELPRCRGCGENGAVHPITVQVDGGDSAGVWHPACLTRARRVGDSR